MKYIDDDSIFFYIKVMASSSKQKEVALVINSENPIRAPKERERKRVVGWRKKKRKQHNQFTVNIYTLP